MELMQLLQMAQQESKPLSQEIVEHMERLKHGAQQVEQLILARRQKTSPPAKAVNYINQVRSSSGQNSSHVIERRQLNDDSDIWFYYLTDMPTSLRTLLIDTITWDERKSNDSAQTNHEDRSINTNESSNDGPMHNISDSQNEDYSLPEQDGGNSSSIDSLAAGAIGAGLTGVVAGATAKEAYDIATDDSLGLFS
jgi:hypothetical protein